MGIFIRAPRIRSIGSNVEILAKLNDDVVVKITKDAVARKYEDEA